MRRSIQDPLKLRRGFLAAVALLLLAPAWHLQESTAIAAGAVILGVMAVLVLDHWVWVRETFRGSPWLISGGLLVAAMIGLSVLYIAGFVERLASFPQWAAGSANRPYFYVIQFARDMPLIWPLFPVAVVIALRTHRRIALYSLVMLLAALIVHSLAGSKSTRYVYYALPFFAVVWGCALSGVLAYLRGADANGVSSTGGSVWVGALVIVVLMAGLSQEGQRALKTAVGKVRPVEVLGYAVEADWSPDVAGLLPAAANADRIVTSNAMKSIYYLGRYDYELNVSIVEETETGQEFGRDIRTGHYAIGTAQSINEVLDMPGRSLVVLEEEKIGKESGVPSEAMTVIMTRCTKIELPPGGGIRAWECGPNGAPSG